MFGRFFSPRTEKEESWYNNKMRAISVAVCVALIQGAPITQEHYESVMQLLYDVALEGKSPENQISRMRDLEYLAGKYRPELNKQLPGKIQTALKEGKIPQKQGRFAGLTSLIAA